MRVLQIANFVSPKSGGIRTSIDILRGGYESRGWTVGRLTPYPDHDSKHDIVGLASIRLPKVGDYRVFIKRGPIKRAIEEFKPDVVELSDKTTLAWLPEWCSRRGIPCCVISHERLDHTLRHAGMYSKPLLFLARRWKVEIEQFATQIVCASQFAAAEFNVPSHRLSRIPLGVAIETVHPRTSRTSRCSSPVIVMCSRLSEEKRPHIAIEAVRVLSKKLNVQMRVLGDGPLRGALEELSVGLPIHFLGHISDRSQVFHEMRNADVVINLGQFETFGLVTLEALATGTPVVVANSGASPELVDSSCGRVVVPEPHTVADAIFEILTANDPTMFQLCRRRAEEYPWGRSIDLFCDLYDQVLKESSAR